MISIKQQGSRLSNRSWSSALISSFIIVTIVCSYKINASDQVLRSDPQIGYEFGASNNEKSLPIYTLDDQHQLLEAQNQALHTNIPGHYEFQVAPKLEPPTVRKPPYSLSNQNCPGSDPFSGFLPKDNLCGDLNQGRVPKNPLGHNIGDQPYPFELIKNKTLQFLARALPILKDEYEAIPKVARYVPNYQLLNPTHQMSPLSNDQMDQINRLFADASSQSSAILYPTEDIAMDLYNQAAQAPPFVRKRRRARSVAASSGKSELLPASSPYLTGLTVGELGTNATLVVLSSAHSAPNRASHRYSLTDDDSLVSSESRIIVTPESRSRLITGPITRRQTNAHASSPSMVKSSMALSVVNQNSTTTTTSNSNSNSNGNSLAGSPTKEPATTRSDNNYQLEPSAVRQNRNNNNNFQHRILEQTVSQQQSSSSAEVVDAHAILTKVTSSPKHSLIQARSSSSGSGTRNSIGNSNSNNYQSETVLDFNQRYETAKTESAKTRQRDQQSQNQDQNHQVHHNQQHDSNNNNKSQHQHQHQHHQQQQQQLDAISNSSNNGPARQTASNGSSNVEKKAPLTSNSSPCSELSNSYLISICQLANYVIEGGTSTKKANQQQQTPGWIQFLGQMSSIATSAADNPIWSAITSLAASSQTEAKNSVGTTSKPQSSSNSSPASSNVGPTNRMHSPGGSALLNLISSFLFTGSDNEPTNQRTSSPSNSKDVSKSITNVGSDLLTGTGLSSTLTRLALAAWATQKISLMADYILPSSWNLFGSENNSNSFARRKKVADFQEQFVDTPASLKMSAAAASLASSQLRDNSPISNLPTKQPPTPCPSIEEYISPTFARNYQGAWKYVVQIPHEGYFTQTIQRTSCMRQKCEFTEGLCHESPRWVSLLVAEIYYPNAVFGQSAQSTQNVANSGSGGLNVASSMASQSQAILNSATQPATNNNIINAQIPSRPGSTTHQGQVTRSKGSQDPLQMIDSLNTFDHNNLNNYLTNGGFDLSNILPGWSTDQVMNAIPYGVNDYSNVLQQRIGTSQSDHNGQSSQQSQAQSSPAFDYSVYGPQLYQTSANLGDETSQRLTAGSLNNVNQDYLISLAAALLQQNPKLSPEELLQTLQQTPLFYQPAQTTRQVIRKKRDNNEGKYQKQHIYSTYNQPDNSRPVQYNPPSQYIPASQQQQHHQQINQLQSNEADLKLGAADVKHQLTSFQMQHKSGQLDQQRNGQQTKEFISNSQIGGSGNSPSQQTITRPTTFEHITQSPPSNQASSLQAPQFVSEISTYPNNITPSQSGIVTNVQRDAPLSMDQQQNVAPQAQKVQQTGQQIDCDGHDKIGCYVVRVYYDWFLVNGSCKCWKSSSNAQSGARTTSSAATNSFLRRIFTG